MARFLLTAFMGFVACQQVLAAEDGHGHGHGHDTTSHCSDPELDLCDYKEDSGSTGQCSDPELDLCDYKEDSGSTSQCSDSELDLCDYKDSGKGPSKSFELHTFEGAGCAKARDPASFPIDLNKCTTLDSATTKVTKKGADSVYMMLGESGCKDSAGKWGSGHAYYCKNDGSECCDFSMDGVAFSYKVGPKSSSSSSNTPTPSPSPTPAPQGTEAADSANGQASAVLLASALAGVGTLLLNAA